MNLDSKPRVWRKRKRVDQAVGLAAARADFLRPSDIWHSLTQPAAEVVSPHDRHCHARSQAAPFEAFEFGSARGVRVPAAIEARISGRAEGCHADDARDGRREKSQTERFGETTRSCLARLATSQYFQAARRQLLLAGRGRGRERSYGCSINWPRIRASWETMRRVTTMDERFNISSWETGISVSGRIMRSASCASQRSTNSKKPPCNRAEPWVAQPCGPIACPGSIVERSDESAATDGNHRVNLLGLIYC